MARKNLRKSIYHYPRKLISYVLYAFSFLPSPFRVRMYRKLKAYEGREIFTADEPVKYVR